MKPTIEVGALIRPYTRTLPVITYHQEINGNGNDEADEFFIRAKKHTGMNIWYSDCAELNESGSHALASGGGLVVFVPRVVKQGEIIRVTSVFPNGSAARGTIMRAPMEFATPLEFELGMVAQPK